MLDDGALGLFQAEPDEAGLPPGLRWLLRRSKNWKPVSTPSLEVLGIIREDDEL